MDYDLDLLAGFTEIGEGCYRHTIAVPVEEEGWTATLHTLDRWQDLASPFRLVDAYDTGR